MRKAYYQIAFTDSVKAEQTAKGSRASYSRLEDARDQDTALGAAERAFLAQVQSFYMASVNSDGWPYVQHRGGPRGFVKVLDERRIGFADFAGNKQYISLGNLKDDNRVSLFFMDYAKKRRWKAFGHAEFISGEQARTLTVPGYSAVVERGVTITLEGFEWNCPQHIPERYDLEDIQRATATMGARIVELEAELAAKS
ncbi:MAG: pyridoxamine 5'-phosphate oxidase family protein [Pseudomonadota bacterium]